MSNNPTARYGFMAMVFQISPQIFLKLHAIRGCRFRGPLPAITEG
jgi:hypothetical protein